jgi:hypothetical protein
MHERKEHDPPRGRSTSHTRLDEPYLSKRDLRDAGGAEAWRLDVSEEEKRVLLQGMQDDLDGIYPLPKLKREVVTQHLVPRKMSYDEFKQDIMVPFLFIGCIGCILKLFL